MNRSKYEYGLAILLMIIGLIDMVHAQDANIGFPVIQVTKLEDVSDFSLSNDSNKLLIERTNGDLDIWDISASQIVLTINSSTFGTTLSSISWSPNDNLIAGAFSDKGRVWSSQTGRLMYELGDHPIQPIDFAESQLATGVDGIVFSPTGESLATYNYFDSTVLIYNIQTTAISHQLRDHRDGGIEEISFSPDGRFLAVRQFVGGITIWNTQTGDRLFQFLGEAMAFSADSTMLATGMGRFVSHIWIWDLSNGNEMYEMVAPLQLDQLQWANDNQTVYGRFGGPPLSEGWIYNGEAIRGWNISESTYRHTFALPEDISLPLALEQNEILIGIGSYQLEGEVLLWNQINNDVFRETLSEDISSDQNQTIYVHLRCTPLSRQ